MSSDPQRSGPREAELDAEQELEISRFWWTLVARWWLLALGLALGILVGYLVSLGGGRVYQARAVVYLGQPLSPSSSGQVQSQATNPSVVSAIVKSQSVVNAVAAQVGVPPGKLRAGISSGAVSGNVARSGQTPLVNITVRGPWRKQAAEAANLLAERVIQGVSSYPRAKIAALQTQLEAQTQEIDALDANVARYQRAIEGSGLSTGERLTLVGLLNAAQVARGQAVDARVQTQLQLELARNVEQGQVITRAAATKVAARGRGTSMIVGGIIGLLAGVAAALAWEPAVRRLAARRAERPSR